MKKLSLSCRANSNVSAPRLPDTFRDGDRSRVTVARCLRAAASIFLVACGGSSSTDIITPPIVRDTTAPTVTATKPVNDAVGAALNSTLSITFSEPINAATLTSTTVTVAGAGAAIAGSVTFSDSTATFTPAAALAGSTKFTVTITTGVKDLAGNGLATDYVWSFTTAAPPDVTPPTVVSRTPLNDAEKVALTVAPTVTMSEAMNLATLNTSTILLTKAGDVAPVAGTVSVSGSTATLQPTAALDAGTKYTVTVTTGARDLAGNALASALSWSFTTVAPDPPAPSVAWRNNTVGPIVTSDFAGRDIIDVSGQVLSRGELSPTVSGIDVATGAVTWTTSLPGSYNGSAVFGSLFGGGSYSYLDPLTGAVLWAARDSEEVQFPGLIAIGETIVLPLPGDTILIGRERRTGREKWRARLGHIECQNASFCGILRPIGVDGANGYVLRSSLNEARIMTIGEDGTVREVATASEVAPRIIRPNQMTVMRGTTIFAAWTNYQTAAGIDIVTGAERWRVDLSAIAPGFFPHPTEKSFYSSDGSVLFMQFDGQTEAQAVLQVALNTATGAVLTRRVLSLSEYRLSWQSRCGNAGLARLTPIGLEYTDLRTGLRTTQVRPGLFETLRDNDFTSDMYPVGDGRVLLTSSYGHAPLNGMRCAP